MIDERQRVAAARGAGLAHARVGEGIRPGAGLVHALNAVELDVATGETLAVMGPSGCGKSTLLHLLGGLERPQPGRCGVGAAHRPAEREGAGTAAPPWDRLRLPGLPPDGRAHRRGERRAARTAGRGARGARHDAAPSSRWRGRVHRPADICLRALGGECERFAIARAQQSRSLSSPTNRPATSTAPPPWTCSGSSTACAAGRRCSSSPTTPDRCNRRPADLDARRRLRRGDQADPRHHRPARRSRRTGRRPRGSHPAHLRLAARDLRRRPAEAALLLLAIIAATTTLTLGSSCTGLPMSPSRAPGRPRRARRRGQVSGDPSSVSPPTSPRSRR